LSHAGFRSWGETSRAARSSAMKAGELPIVHRPSRTYRGLRRKGLRRAACATRRQKLCRRRRRLRGCLPHGRRSALLRSSLRRRCQRFHRSRARAPPAGDLGRPRQRHHGHPRPARQDRRAAGQEQAWLAGAWPSRGYRPLSIREIGRCPPRSTVARGPSPCAIVSTGSEQGSNLCSP
jgi:hypothetical protein